MVYTNSTFSLFSFTKINDQFEHYSYWIAKKYPGYMLKENMTFYHPTKETIDLDDLITLLRSKDLARYEAIKET